MKQLLTIFLLTITAIISLTLTAPQVESTTNTLNGTFINNSVINSVGAETSTLNTTANGWSSQHYDVSSLQGITITLSFTPSIVAFSSNSSTIAYNRIIYYASLGGGILPLTQNNEYIIPNNAQRMWIHGAPSGAAFSPNNISVSNLIVSYNTPAPATLTTTTFPNLTFVDNQTINVVTGAPITNNNWVRTDLVDLDTFPTVWNFSPISRSQFDGGQIPTIAVFYDAQYNLIGYSGREVRETSFGPTVGNRIANFPFANNDQIPVLPNNARYVSWLIIKQSTGQTGAGDPGDRTNGTNEVINPASSDLTFNEILNLTFVTNLRLVKWGVVTPQSQGGGTIFFFQDYYTVGTNIQPISDTLVNDPNLPREGFEFTGFDGTNTVGSSTEPIIKLAQYSQLTTYTVVFQDWNGTVLGTDTVVEGQPASPPLIPIRTGYTFDSWLPPISTITGDITTVAQYTPNTYLATWTSDSTEIKAGQVAHDSTILSHAPFVTKEDHVLIGWESAVNNQLITSGQTVTGPLSLTAVWEQVPTYTVTWRDPSFNTLKIEYVQESGVATPPTYNPGSGLVLTGWTPNPTQLITQNTIFIATVTNAPTPPPTYNNENATSITDLFAGVFGAIVGSIMILGTIDLFGIELSALLWLFIAGTGFMMIWKMVR